MNPHLELQFRSMQNRIWVLLFSFALAASTAACALPEPRFPQSASPAKPSGTQQKKLPAAPQTAPKPKSDSAPAEAPDAPVNSDAELQVTVEQASNDRAALIRNLEP